MIGRATLTVAGLVRDKVTLRRILQINTLVDSKEMVAASMQHENAWICLRKPPLIWGYPLGSIALYGGC
jgi:hypothetical protein